jgi:hypothetical protein
MLHFTPLRGTSRQKQQRCLLRLPNDNSYLHILYIISSVVRPQAESEHAKLQVGCAVTHDKGERGEHAAQGVSAAR